jgi:MFS transporter, SP family, sugar:H+ symporter
VLVSSQFFSTSPLTTLLFHDSCLSSTNRSLITSLLSIGTFFGALSGAWVADRLGRRGGIMTAAVVFAVGAAIQT